MTIQKALHLRYDAIYYMCHEKEIENSTAQRIALIHQYKDVRTTLKLATVVEGSPKAPFSYCIEV